MALPELFSIGQVAKLFGVSVGTLRHYEAAGLLTPQSVDPQTGYRWYSTRQFEVLNTIRYLRALDMPLAQIALFLQNRDTQRMEEALRAQKAIISGKRRELEAIERKIDHRLERLEAAREAPLDQVELVLHPPCRLAGMGRSLTPRGYLDLEEPIRQLEAGQKTPVVFLGKVGLGISPQRLLAGQVEGYDRIFLLLDEEDDYQGAVERLPAQLCAAVRFRGSHKEAPASYRRLLRYIRQRRLAIAGFSREITLVDDGLTSDPNKFVTEIHIPVAQETT